MTEVEAIEFVLRLAATWPGVRFSEQNAQAYQSLLVNLEAGECETARVELAETSKFVPTFAEIREVVMRNRKQRRATQEPRPLRLPDLIGPTPHEWGEKLSSMLEDSARWRRMTEAWCEARGLPVPKDPGQAFIDLAQAGARGDDVRTKFRQSIPGLGVDTGEQDELERRFP